MPIRVITPPFRASYAFLTKPRQTPSGDMKYQLSMVFPSGTDLSEMKKAAQDVVVEKWGNDKAKWPRSMKSPFRDGNERDELLYRDTVFVNTSSTGRPGVVDKAKNEIIDEEEIYSGMWARASVTAFAYDQAGNRGVSFGLNNVQKLKDDERLDGRRSAQEDFSDNFSDPAFADNDTSSIFD